MIIGKASRSRLLSHLAAIALLFGLAACSAQAPSSPTMTQPAASTPSPTSAPALHPEGRILFMTAAMNDVSNYYTANADGTDRQHLVNGGSYCCLDRVSPDRSQILVMPGGEPPAPVTGGVLSIDGTDFTPLKLKDPNLNLVPQAWSPDGKRIAFEGWDESDPGRTGIYTGTVGQVHDLVRLTSTDGAPHDSPLDFSPDGSRLVFYRAVRAEPNFPIDIGGSLWVVNVDGSDAHKLKTPPVNWWARWSPDGTKILFPSERNQPTGAIYTIKPDGSDLTTVFQDPDGGFPIDPIWSPDGTQIMFMLDPVSDRFQHPSNVLCVIRADGSGLTRLIDSPDFKNSPEWWAEP
jgi:Tol biopolymer transport system component